MRNVCVLGALLAALVFPTAARAQLQLGVRVGWASAMGDALETKGTPVTPSQTARMSDWIKAQIPIQLDVGYRVTPEITIGGYASYGFGDTGGSYLDACRIYLWDCSASVVRTGVEATYAFTTVSPKIVPWAGLGSGYEWAESVAKRPGSENVRTRLEGWELLDLQAGADYRVGASFAVGAYVMYALGRYSGGSDGGVSFSSSANTTMHQWLGVGVRGTYGL